MLTLILKEGEKPHTLQLSEDVITFGRSKENVVVIRNIKASRHHAKIERIGGTYQITDLGSGNGTRVNGEKVDFQALKAGDEIKIGDAVLTLKSIDDAVEDDRSPSDQPTEEINLDSESSDDLKIEGEEVKLEGEEVIEGEEVELEAEKIEIADDSDDLPSDERETEIAIKPSPGKPGSKPSAPPQKPSASAKPSASPAKPAPAKPAPPPQNAGAKRPMLDRFKKKP